jgi:hypothetical protein
MPSDFPSDQITEDFENIRDRNETTFTYSAASYSGIIETRDETDRTFDPGYLREYQFGIYCVRADFVTLPDIGDTFTNLNSGSYRVVKREFAPDGVIVLFGLDTIQK